MRNSVIAGALVSLLAFPVVAQAKTCERECKTGRTVPAVDLAKWNSPHLGADALVMTRVYVNGHDVPGQQNGGTITFTRGEVTVQTIARARSPRIRIRAANFSNSAVRVTVKFKQVVGEKAR